MKQPRDYQTACHCAVRDAFKKGMRRVLVELSTGTGKTVIFVTMANMVLENAKAKNRTARVLILVNRDVLVQQALEELAANGIIAQREQGQSSASLTTDVVVGSIQSLSDSRIKKWPRDHFTLVILDEAHGSGATSFRKVLDYFESSYHLGVTATAERHDKKALWGQYQDIVYRMPLKDWHDKKTGELTKGGIDQGWLCDFDFRDLECPVTLDEKLAKQATWAEGEEVFDSSKYLPKLAREVAEHVIGRKGLLFLPNCRVSAMFAELLKAQGIDARHVDSSYMTPAQTAETLAWFKTAKCGALCNAQLLTTGYNQPDIDLIGMLRPVSSTSLFKQMLGRGTRPVARVDDYPTPELRKLAIAGSAKPSVRVLNVFWENGSHDLAQPSCLITDDESEKETLNKASKPGAKINLAELQEQLKAKRMADVEEEARKYAEQVARSQQKKVKGLDVYIADILKRRFTGDPATDKQINYIRKLNAPTNGAKLSKSQASAIIGRMLKASGIPDHQPA